MAKAGKRVSTPGRRRKSPDTISAKIEGKGGIVTNAVVLRGDGKAYDREEAMLLVDAAYTGPTLPATIEVTPRMKKGRGPKRGATGHIESARRLFPEIDSLIAGGARSANAAALVLARAKKIQGHGTDESRAKRLAALYLDERNTP